MWCNPFALVVCELWTITLMMKIAGCSRSRDGRIGFEEVHKCVLESSEWCVWSDTRGVHGWAR
jgi:hypothetical protein